MPRRKLDRPTFRLNLRRDRWFIDYTDPDTGRTRSVSTGTDRRADAEIWRDQWIAGRDQPEPPGQPIVSEILGAYEAARRDKVQAPATIAYSAQALIRHIGNLQPHMIATRAYIEARSTEGVAGGTIRREVGVLRAALAWAVKERWIERAPHIDAPGSAPPRERWLTRTEVAALIQAAELHHLRLFIILAYHTAARAGAILDLTWDRVDFEKRTITYDRPGRQQSKKRRAVVPINIVALAELQSAFAMATIDRVIEWRGKPVISIKKSFAAACARAGVTDCSPHILRHTAATHMVMERVELRQIARMLGDTEASVERVYGKHGPDYLRAAADALADPAGPRETVAAVNRNDSTDRAKPPKTLRQTTRKIASTC